MWALVFATAIVCGSLVPFSDELPLSTTMAGFLAALAYMVLSIGLNWVKAVAGPFAAIALALVLVGLLLCLFYVVGEQDGQALARTD